MTPGRHLQTPRLWYNYPSTFSRKPINKMKLTWRKVALIFGAVALLGLIPDSLNLQSPRDERIVIAARDYSDLRIENPSAPVISVVPTQPAPVSIQATPNTAVTANPGSVTSGNTPVPIAPAVPAVLTPPAGVQAPPLTQEERDNSDQRATARDAVAPPRPYESLELYIHLPPDAARHQPLRTLIVLHGIGSRGDTFSQNLIEEADRNYWILIAPTLPYRDYMDPANLLKEDIRFSGLLVDMLDNLPKKLGMKLRRHALVFGFSRGAQLGHRFALFYPERVESIVPISAGTYTLPVDRKTTDPNALMPMPYGVGDMVNYLGHPLDRELLRQISFLLEVGGRDVEPDEVPRQFDPYSGKDRVARAYAFQYALISAGVKSRLTVFPDAGHEVTAEMRRAALQFLREEELAKKLND